MIELKHLRLLRAIVEAETLSGAARALGYSQPAITQQLQVLERFLETPVVIRTGGKLGPTPVGEVLLRQGAHVLGVVSRMESEIASIRDLSAGRLRVAAFPSANASIVPRAMSAMTQRFPGLSFSLLEAKPPEALELLSTGRCDIAIVFNYSSEPPLDRADLSWHRLMDETVHLLLPNDYKVPSNGNIQLKDLWSASWIAGCPTCRGNILASCRETGFEPRIEFETEDYVALQSLAASGLGISLVPDLVLSLVHNSGVKLVNPVPAQQRSIEAVTTPGLLTTPGVRTMIDALLAAASDISAEIDSSVHTRVVHE